MGTEATKPSVEFTPEAERALLERTEAFAEELRLTAIDEAIRRRGSASEVTASDVLRAAARALEQQSLEAYEQKLNMLVHMVEEQSHRSREASTELAYRLRNEIERLAGVMGLSKEREHEFQKLYQTLQEQTYASTLELRNLLAHELGPLRAALAERAQKKIGAFDRFERFGWAYVFTGALIGGVGIILPYVRSALEEPSARLYALLVAIGFLVAMSGGVLIIFKRIRPS